MQASRRYSFFAVIRWQSNFLPFLLLYNAIPISLYALFGWDWLILPWQPLSLIGTAVAFYLGFKNNSSYDRLWEARKIWGGIVNASRSFTVMARDFLTNPGAKSQLDSEEARQAVSKLVYRHIAWLHALSLELRKPKKWEHFSPRDQKFRTLANTSFSEDRFLEIRPYLSNDDYDYLMQKGNKSSHLLSLQSKHIMQLRNLGLIDEFLHMQLQGMITEFYTLMGKSERIKNYPFPRQYASINFYFVALFMMLIPFCILSVFQPIGNVFWAIPISFALSWVFIMMEMIGDYSENPFEGLYNDVPISGLSKSIEIDIRQMLDEIEDLPKPLKPVGDMEILI